MNTNELFQAVRLWVGQCYPQAHRARLVIRLPDGQKVRLPVQLGAMPAVGSGMAVSDTAAATDESWQPNAFQAGILDALAGRALRVDKLAEIVKDRPRLYRDPGGIKELQRRGLVGYEKWHGYFRSDALPDDMEE